MNGDPYKIGTIARYEFQSGDRRAARELIEASLAPALRHDLVAALTQLRLTTVSRNADESEMRMIGAAYLEALVDYPGDATLTALRYWPRNHKFWPALAELIDEIKQRIEHRLLLAQAVGLGALP